MTMASLRDFAICPGERKMNPGIENTQRGRTPGRSVVSWAKGAFVCLTLALLVIPGAWGQRGMRRAQAARPPAARQQAPRMSGNARPRVNPEMRPGVNGRPGMNGRPGQEHLREWMAQHPSLQEQESLLRREPGFNRLAPQQQQRVLNRLRTLDARPQQQRERQADRVEMFERLSPEQRQDVRGAAQSMATMPPGRKAMMTRAFNDLRQIPPEQRQEILNSARFSNTFTPQERHVLGSLLSIEPYAPR